MNTLKVFIAKLEAMGVRMTVEEDAIFVEEQGDLNLLTLRRRLIQVLQQIYNNR